MVCLNYQGKSQTGAMMTKFSHEAEIHAFHEALRNLLLNKFLLYKTILHGDTHLSQLHLQNLCVDAKLRPGRGSVHSVAT